MKLNRSFIFGKNKGKDPPKVTEFKDQDDFVRSLKIDKRSSRGYNLPIIYKTIDLKYDILKKIKGSIKNKIFNEIPSHILRDFIIFTRERPFKILQCDKNVGVLLITHESHNSLAMLHLNNNITYEKINVNPLAEITDNINSKLKQLHDTGHISSKLYKILILEKDTCKLGKFRILPKIHKKDKFSTRPIINCKGHPTEKMCQVIDMIFKHILKDADTVLKDSQELLQVCENDSFDSKDIHLYSCDFESLYTNIKPGHASSLICDFIKDHKIFDNETHFSLFGLFTLLSLIFKNGYFSFNNQYYLQKVGLPMGCKCGPSVANLFLFIYLFLIEFTIYITNSYTKDS